MKRPEEPPSKESYHELFSSPKRAGEVLKHATSPIHNGRYVHWDKLRYLTPPADLSNIEWWWALKFTRSLMLKSYRFFPARDFQSRMKELSKR
jgi:hypothetical protein